MKAPKGFTLIELLVVIAIIGILASIVLVSLSSARAKSRDGQRISELKEMQKALELYYSDHGRYPISTCAAPNNYWTSFDSPTFSPRLLCAQAWTAGTETLAQEMAQYISPIMDPKNVASDAGFLYVSASNGQSYCFMSHRNPENLTNFPSNFINPYRCGSGNTTAQCSSNGTGGSSANAIYIGTGSFASAGC